MKRRLRLLAAASSLAVAASHGGEDEHSSLTMMGELHSWGAEDERKDTGKELVSVVGASEVMKDVCLETVRHAEEGVKSEEDAVRLSGTVAPSCLKGATRRLGEAASEGSDLHRTLQAWCSNLDGRLTLALETGFFFARDPAEAEREAGGPNPYAYATRRQFCERFARATSKKAAALEAELVKTQSAMHAEEVAKIRQADEATLERAAEAEKSATVLSATARKEEAMMDSEVAAQERAYASWAMQRQAQASKVAASLPNGANGGQQKGIDMLHLVQVLTERTDAWNKVCEELLTGLSSEEGSVSDEEVLGQESPNMHSAMADLTFNGGDQQRVRRCATQLKVIGIDTGLLHSGASAAATHGEASFSQLGASATDSEDAALGAALGAADSNALEALVESPWARDACIDLARGFLTARLALAKENVIMSPAQFCPRYARDLQEMRSTPGPLIPHQQVAAPAAAATAVQKKTAVSVEAAAERPAAATATAAQSAPSATTAPQENKPQQQAVVSASAQEDLKRLRQRGQQKAWDSQRHSTPAAAGGVGGGVQGKVLAARAVSQRVKQQQPPQQHATPPLPPARPQAATSAAAAQQPAAQRAPHQVALAAQDVTVAAAVGNQARVLGAEEGSSDEDEDGADFWSAGF